MENTKMHEVIISTGIRFTTEDSVTAYKALPMEDLPEDDMEYNEVTRYIVGFNKIVLFGMRGRRLATFLRRDVTGMAVDGKPVILRGPDFKRIGIATDTTDTEDAITDTPEADADTGNDTEATDA